MLSNAVTCPLFAANANILPVHRIETNHSGRSATACVTVLSALQPEIPESGPLCYSDSQRSAARQKN